MQEAHKPLFEPIKVGGVTLPNRFVMGSMHTGLESHPERFDDLGRFYAERARGGAALVVTGGFAPNFNGRMKDYYDLWALPKAVDLDPEDLQASIEKTFERRQTEVPTERPPGLSQAFATDATKSAQWRAYSEATEIEGMSLAEVVDDIWTTLEPICAHVGAARN